MKSAFYLKTSIALNKRNIFQLMTVQYENWSQHHTLPAFLLSFAICIVSKVVDIHQMLRCFVICTRKARNNPRFVRCRSCHFASAASELRIGVKDNAVEMTWSAACSYGRVYDKDYDSAAATVATVCAINAVLCDCSLLLHCLTLAVAASSAVASGVCHNLPNYECYYSCAFKALYFCSTSILLVSK